MSRRAFINGRILSADGFEEDRTVLVEGDRIAAIVDDLPSAHADYQIFDLAGDMLVPGFIDAQVNGGGGVMFNDAPTVETLRTMMDGHRRFGTVGMLPTLITTDFDTMRRAIEAVGEAIASGVPGILGIHLEGPVLNPDRRGVHDHLQFVSLTAELIELLSTAQAGRIMVTLAPEQVEPSQIAQLVKTGIIVSLGHTAADYRSAKVAFAAGATSVTHLFNAMPPLLSRDPGLIGAALEDPNVFCGIIADGFHAAPATLRVAIQAKEPGKVILVTDAMATVGSDQASFNLYGQKIRCENGRCATADGTLAGSALDMATAVRNTVEMFDINLAEAVRMASLYPARLLGLGSELGQIAPGYRASFAILDDGVRVRSMVLDGIVHHRA